MITGYAKYEPTPEDEVADDFNRSRLAMIERVVEGYPYLRAERKWDVDTFYLDVLPPRQDSAGEDGPDQDNTESYEQALHDFAMQLEDSNLGYLTWEYETPEERSLLESLCVAIMNCHNRTDDEPFPDEGAYELG